MKLICTPKVRHFWGAYQIKEDKKPIKPGDTIGKIDVHDTRERRDGPGGN